MPNEATLHLESGLRFSATTGSGFRIELDSRLNPEDALTAPSPMELQLVALGGCTAMDVISILRKMHQDVTDYDLRLTGDRAPEHPRVYTTVQIIHSVRGRELVEVNVHRAIQLTMDRYCPVFAMLYPRVAVTERYELIDDGTGATLATGDVARSVEAPAAG
jgi:putative redox protein